MSIEVPPPQGQISPDGRWFWDGTKWSPRTSAPPGPQPPAITAYVVTPPNNGTAVAALIVGILSWFLCPLIGGVAAVILGHVARGQIRRSGEGGDGLAIAGLVLGYAHLAVYGALLVIWLVILGGMAAFIGILGTLPVASPSP